MFSNITHLIFSNWAHSKHGLLYTAVKLIISGDGIFSQVKAHYFVLDYVESICSETENPQ